MVSRSIIEAARQNDAIEIAALLEESGLSKSGVESNLSGFLVATSANKSAPPESSPRVVGTVCIERYDDEALLRSLAVSLEMRGLGLGARLVQAAVDRAIDFGCTRLVLLTNDAASFFSRYGFTEVDRAGFESPVTRSGQYQSECPDSAVLMTRTLSR